MQSPKRFGLAALVLSSILSGGCIDAWGNGFADGVTVATSAIIETLITQAFEQIAPSTGGE